MKIGISLLIVGVLLLVLSIPVSILLMIGGVNEIVSGSASGGPIIYASLAGVILGFILTTIGATRVFMR